MKYRLSKLVAGSTDFLDVDENEYQRIIKSRENLYEVLFIEEKFDLLLENYYEYETELLNIASRMMIFSIHDHFSMSHARNLIGRRIINLLSAGRLYIDQVPHHMNKIFGKDSCETSNIRDEIKAQYEKWLGYRVMDNLRNHALHRGFPIHSIKFSYQRTNISEAFQLRHRVIPLIGVEPLRDDEKLKKSVLSELMVIQSNNYVDARPLIREYLEGLCNIHLKVRNVIGIEIETWQTCLEKWISGFQNKYGKEPPYGLEAEDNRNRKNIIFVSKDPIERRVELESKNREFVNLHRCFVSNEFCVGDA